MADTNSTSTPPTTAVAPNQPQQPVQLKRGYVKQVLSGDSVVLQGAAVNGPPKEMTVYLSNVVAPRLGKRPTDTSPATPDEPYAWEAREFLRLKIVGKEVTFIRDFTATSGREHGRVLLGSSETAENVAESSVAEGWLEVRQSGKGTDEYVQRLIDLQDAAKVAKKGRWASDDEARKHIRDVKWIVDNPRNFVDSLKQKPQKAIIEQVRDGTTVRAILLPDYYYVTVMMSGVKAPLLRTGAEGKVLEADPYGEEARYFVECRLLQRDVEIILESVSNQNFVGSILHPKGNIAELLLKEGFARCVDWSIAIASCGSEVMRAAERSAKERRLRIWKSYTPSNNLAADKRTFEAKVIEIVMGDALIIRKNDDEEMKIWLSSIRPPRSEDGKENQTPGRQFRPLYDIPFMFEAREFLRKRLIGKKVNVTIDYVQPSHDQFPEKTCCTVIASQQNVAEALVAKGLATVVLYRQDDDNRSAHYDALLAAEANAKKSKKGIHAGKEAGEKQSILRIQELQGDATRSKQFLPYLQRVGRSEALVEFVTSGSRLRLYVPKETCLITFLLSGINCPRSARPAQGAAASTEGEPFAAEATQFTRLKCLQHEVEIEVETLDKSGNFIGYLFVHGDHGTWTNLAELLVENGLATVHFTAERSKHYGQLVAAESRAKAKRLKIWETYVEEPTADQDELSSSHEKTERNVNYKKVVIADIADTLHFAAQNFDDGPKLEQLMKDLRADLQAKPPVTGSYTPRRGELCAAKFVDNQWYRARIESVRGNKADIIYIDFGNRESIDILKLAQLPSSFTSMPAGAKEYMLAFVQLPNDPDYAANSIAAFKSIASNDAYLLLNVEYRINGIEHVTLFGERADGTRIDIGKKLVERGHLLIDQRRESRLQSVMNEYVEAQATAKKERMNIWEYGDFTGNEL